MVPPIRSDFEPCQNSFCNLASPHKKQMPTRLKKHDQKDISSYRLKRWRGIMGLFLLGMDCFKKLIVNQVHSYFQLPPFLRKIRIKTPAALNRNSLSGIPDYPDKENRSKFSQAIIVYNICIIKNNSTVRRVYLIKYVYTVKQLFMIYTFTRITST